MTDRDRLKDALVHEENAVMLYRKYTRVERDVRAVWHERELARGSDKDEIGKVQWLRL